jgi:hypothetical protein
LAVGPLFLAASYWGAKEWQRRQAGWEATTPSADLDLRFDPNATPGFATAQTASPMP